MKMKKIESSSRTVPPFGGKKGKEKIKKANAAAKSGRPSRHDKGRR